MAEPLVLKNFFRSAVEAGMEMDPRGKKILRREMSERKKTFKELSPPDREYFDPETLTNPYADSRILFGDPAVSVKTVAVGIDIGAGEMVLVDRLKQLGKPIDLVVSHHPAGRAYANFYEVMKMQADMLSSQGVPITQAEGALKRRISEVSRKVSAANHNRVVDAARLLNIPLCCLHTVADNHVYHYLEQLFQKKKPYRVRDIIDLLMEEPEFKTARRNNSGPAIFAGEPDNRCGRIGFEMTGGTTGSKKAIEQLSASGIGTLVVMHLPEEYRKLCEKHHVNVVCSGHIASDSLGLNLMLQNIRKKTPSKFSVVAISGFIYVTDR